MHFGAILGPDRPNQLIPRLFDFHVGHLPHLGHRGLEQWIPALYSHQPYPDGTSSSHQYRHQILILRSVMMERAQGISVGRTLTIEGRRLPVTFLDVPIGDVELDPRNPRINYQ